MHALSSLSANNYGGCACVRVCAKRPTGNCHTGGVFLSYLTIRSFWAVAPMVRSGTKPPCLSGMLAGRAAVVPAGLRWRAAPAPHAGVEAAGTGMRLVLEGVRRRTTKVRRGIVSWFRHTVTTRSLPFEGRR